MTSPEETNAVVTLVVNRAVNDPVGRAVYRAVNRAVFVPVTDAVYWAVEPVNLAVNNAVHGEIP